MLFRSAQADDGSVWYFGEDVFNYEKGVVADTEGTWLAGVNGPAGMIMPAHPKVGDVYRTENVPGLVFEQVTVRTVGKTVDGPHGPVEGAMVGEELHQDGNREAKTFAPGYGEFFSGTGGDVEAMALAIPADELSGPPPAELKTLGRGADDAFEAARSQDWDTASAAVEKLNTAWDALREGDVPQRLAAQMSGALGALAGGVGAHKPQQASQAALDVALVGLDLQLRHLPPARIDLARFDLRARQLLLDAAAGDVAAVTGDVTTLEWIRDRLRLAGAVARRIDDQLRYLAAAAEAEELEAVTGAAERLRETLARLQTSS